MAVKHGGAIMTIQDFLAMRQFTLPYAECQEGRNDHGHRREIKIRAVDILYALKEKNITLLGESPKRLPIIEEFNIFKMAQECTQIGSPAEEIAPLTRQIKNVTKQALFHECEDSETSDVEMAISPKTKRSLELRALENNGRCRLPKTLKNAII